jgi:NadR type nicotinamide-nucleotide adenylyltransferase
MKAFKLGFVVGKFTPLHRGHMYLIDTALANCEHVVVLTYGNPSLGFAPHWKRIWFKELYPQVTLISPDTSEAPHNDASELEHRQFCERLLTKNKLRPNVVFSSESYGEPFAEQLQAWWGQPVAHIMVDGGRKVVPVSGTRLREEKGIWSEYVHPIVQRNRTCRLTILGGESSGKTTLAKALSEATGYPWVAEYGREYCEKIGGVKNLKFEDLLEIGREQIRRENEVVDSCEQPWVICDTSPLTTRFYSEALFKDVDPKLFFLAKRHHYDLTLLLGREEHEWVQDGDRMSPEFSNEQDQWYIDNIHDYDSTAFFPGGSVEERVKSAIQLMEDKPIYGWHK